LAWRGPLSAPLSVLIPPRVLVPSTQTLKKMSNLVHPRWRRTLAAEEEAPLSVLLAPRVRLPSMQPLKMMAVLVPPLHAPPMRLPSL
jgi:hypothetical protein